MSKIKIEIPSTFNFQHCLAYLNQSSLEIMHRVNKECIYKLMYFTGKPVVLKVKQKDNLLVVENLNGGKLNVAWKHAIHNFIIDWFDLDRDLRPFYKMAANDKILHEVVKTYDGLRLMGIPDLFEAISWAILGQQINLNFAYRLKERLVKEYGKSFKHKKNTYYAFPNPETIAKLSPEDLRPFQISQRKAEYLIGVAKIMAQGSLDKNALLKLSPKAAKTKLIKIRGIGNWTANYVIMKCLRYPDGFPLKDVGLHNALKLQLKLSEKPDLVTVKKMGNNWKPWRGYATFYLWQTLSTA